MDYFKINKYSSIEENILYISKNIIELLKGSEKEFGKIVELYEKKFFTEMRVNIETSIYLAILFLFGIGKIDIENKKIKLVVEWYDFERTLCYFIKRKRDY